VVLCLLAVAAAPHTDKIFKKIATKWYVTICLKLNQSQLSRLKVNQARYLFFLNKLKNIF